MNATINISEIIDALKDVEEVIGIAVFNKFGAVKENSLPTWIVPKTIIDFVNSLLKISNETLHELKQGKVVKTLIESDKANILISIVGEEIILIMTKNNFQIKLFEDRSKVLFLKT